ncbi:hypothetical protein [Ruficoccus sp. ZRK36]|nr:hypothetical protein [Ruficoccus sp. ZRK36]
MPYEAADFFADVSKWAAFYGAVWTSQVIIRFLKRMFDASSDLVG